MPDSEDVDRKSASGQWPRSTPAAPSFLPTPSVTQSTCDTIPIYPACNCASDAFLSPSTSSRFPHERSHTPIKLASYEIIDRPRHRHSTLSSPSSLFQPRPPIRTTFAAHYPYIQQGHDRHCRRPATSTATRKVAKRSSHRRLPTCPIPLPDRERHRSLPLPPSKMTLTLHRPPRLRLPLWTGPAL